MHRLCGGLLSVVGVKLMDLSLVEQLAWYELGGSIDSGVRRAARRDQYLLLRGRCRSEMGGLAYDQRLHGRSSLAT